MYLIKLAGNTFANTDMGSEIEKAFEKFVILAPNEQFRFMDKFKTLFMTSKKFIKDYSGKEEIIEQLIQTMLNKL